MNKRKDLRQNWNGLSQQLEGMQGKTYWRSLEELAGGEAFGELVRQEFPEQSFDVADSISRRQFTTLMGASLALAGLGGCSIRPGPTKILAPMARAHEELAPGKPLFYATAMTLGGAGVGLLVESHEGRPTKIEGNPDHPASLGATSLYHQAAVLGLYDPDRSQHITHLGTPMTWDDVRSALRSAVEQSLPRGGDGLQLLTETVVSPTLGSQIEAFLKSFPKAKWRQFEPLAGNSAHRAAVAGFGKPLNTYCRLYDFANKRRTADVIVSLDADFLTCGPGSVRTTAEFAAGRRVRGPSADAAKAAMSRLYVVETALTNTGAKADHRLALPASVIDLVARTLAVELGVPGAPAATQVPAQVQRCPEVKRRSRVVEAFCRLLFRMSVRCDGVFATADRSAVVCVWPPGSEWPSHWAFLRSGGLSFLLRLGLRGSRLLAYIERELDAARGTHVPGSHWYVSLLGVRPDAQGRGRARAVLQPVFEAADRDRLPIYLETMLEANVAIYKKLGFELRGHRSLKGGLTNWEMVREPE